MLLIRLVNFNCLQKPLIFQGKKQILQEKVNDVLEAYGFLNTFLEESKWVAGEEVTIADFSIYETATSLNVIVPIDKDKYPNVLRWIGQVNELPRTEVCKQGFLDFGRLVKTKLEDGN